MSEWAFVTNHAVVLSIIERHPRITALEIAHEISITERAVRKIIKDLVDAGYLSKTKEGRGVFYRVKKNLPMRHPAQRNKIIGDLLNLLGRKGSHLFILAVSFCDQAEAISTALMV